MLPDGMSSTLPDPIDVPWNPEDPPVWIPTADEVTERLQQILDRGSLNLGAKPDTERLLLMLTRSCQLRCGYCFVKTTEFGTDMTFDVAQDGVDLIMRSDRDNLQVQFFGGEPTRRWDLVTEILAYTWQHPLRRGRPVEFVVTTNGATMTPDKVAVLERYPVTVLFSVDGDAAAHKRFRHAHLMSDEDAYAHIDRTIDLLKASSLNWFANVTVPPAGSRDVFDRYTWARERGIPRLQLNYSVGHYWNPEQEARYLSAIQQALFHHARFPGGLHLFNWRSDCEPTMLSDDLIVDVDGSVVHDGAIFLERSLPELKVTYDRGHLEGLDEFDTLRWSLAKLDRVQRGTYPEGSKEHRAIVQNIRMGAAVDLVIRRVQDLVGDLHPLKERRES